MLHRHSKVVLALTLILLALCPATLGAEYFVSTGGSNSNDGSSAHPWLTIQHAVNSIAPGDVITVGDGTYVGAKMTSSGATGAPKTLRAENNGGAILNASSPINWHNAVIEVEGQNYWIIDGFEIDGVNNTYRGIDIRVCEHNTVRNCHVHDTYLTGIFDGFHTYALYENNVSHDNGEHGIYHSNSEDYAVIRGNTCYSNASCGIHMNGDISMGGDGVIRHCTIEKNICYDNPSGSGINMDGVSDSIVRNNLLYDNHGSGISLYAIDAAEGSSNNIIANNTVVNASDGRWALNIPPSSGGQPHPTDNKVFNNIFYTRHSWRGTISTHPSCLPGFECDYNVVMNRFSIDSGDSRITLADWQGHGFDTHSIIATPADLFVDEASGDYHLKDGSPAINIGIEVAEVTEDIEGTPRPQDGLYDIGAYEVASQASTYYVSTSGDNLDDGSQAHPWRTIQHAADMVSAGDTVIVLAGDYNETVNINNLNGTEAEPVTISGVQGAHLAAVGNDALMIYQSAWIVVEGLEVTGANGKAGIRIAESNHITLSSCKFSGNTPWCVKTGLSDYVTVSNCRMDGGGAPICIYFSTTDHPVLSGCELSNAQMGLHVNGDLGEGGDGMISYAQFVGNTIHDITQTGINLDGVEHSLVANNLLYDNTGKGIASFHGDGRETGSFDVFANNTVCFGSGQGRYAFRITGGGSHNAIVNNIFINSSGQEAALAMSSDSLSDLTCDHNILFGLAGHGSISIDDGFITLAQWRTHGFGAASMEVAPDDVFTDAAGDDYTLRYNSPAIDQGVALGEVTDDIEGTPRPQGDDYDIGAYEYGTGNPDDSDSDGLPDAWEVEYFGDLDEDGDGDYDSDGVDNGDEYTDGTDPT
ncbi:MAG: right-handed parallel beta-helix repeat-containing protein, partial [Planctomycetes bacterium]|nr:right-handed parallel beta-helix repeat-containing protein [Planctomycetota bacterium]